MVLSFLYNRSKLFYLLQVYDHDEMRNTLVAIVRIRRSDISLLANYGHIEYWIKTKCDKAKTDNVWKALFQKAQWFL